MDLHLESATYLVSAGVVDTVAGDPGPRHTVCPRCLLLLSFAVFSPSYETKKVIISMWFCSYLNYIRMCFFMRKHIFYRRLLFQFNQQLKTQDLFLLQCVSKCDIMQDVIYSITVSNGNLDK